MSYIPHTEEDIKEMLATIGIEDIKGLFSYIPDKLLLKEPLNIPDGFSEQEVFKSLHSLSRRNSTDHISFLGGGQYRHYIPKAIHHLISRSEFYTSYTPYQPEISQGTLQAIFEFQTLICQLTGMDVANASMYDGASATAEAVLMARRVNKKKGVILSSALHPEYRDTIRTYLMGSEGDIKEPLYCTETGRTLPESIEGFVDKDTSCVVIQQPNFFGSIEDLGGISRVVHESGALLIVVVTEPISLGILKPPGDYGADIVAGEGQSLGIPISLGGPSFGFFATRASYLRQMPGRIVGETVDTKGERAFVLTLATREQHIRRERSTSNICTNAGLSALAATIYMTLLGRRGFRELALLNIKKTGYAKRALSEIKGVRLAFNSPTFNEFVVDIGKDGAGFLEYARGKGIFAGISLERFYTELKGSILISVTELNTLKEIDTLKEIIDGYL